MKTETMTLAAALNVLASTTKTEDGVFNAALSESAQRLREQERKIEALVNALIRARDSLRFFKSAGFNEDRVRGEPDALKIVEDAIDAARNQEKAP